MIFEIFVACGVYKTVVSFPWLGYSLGLINALGIYAVKELVDDYKRRRAPQRRAEEIRDQASPADFSPMLIHREDIDQTSELLDRITKILESSEDHGLFIISAPPGAGKTTLLAKAMRTVKYKGISIHYISGLTEKTLPDMGITSTTLIGLVLAKGSVIVIDQLDVSRERLTTAMEESLVKLATESSNSRIFKVVVVISNVETRDAVLKLNSGEKIVAINQGREFFWTTEMLLQLCGYQLPHWSEADREQLTALVAQAGAPSTLMALCHKVRFTSRFPSGMRLEEIQKDLSTKISMKLSAWDAFDRSPVVVWTVYRD